MTKAESTELHAVKQRMQELLAEDRGEELIELVFSMLVQAKEANSQLTDRLHALLRQLYGRKSEKVSAAQMALELEKLGDAVPEGAAAGVGDGAEQASDTAAASADGTVPQPTEPPRRLSNRGKTGGDRTPFPASLPRRRRFIAVSDELRVCSCGCAKIPMGVDRSEVLEFRPAELVVIEQEREKLACPKCKAGVVIAPSEQPMDRGRPGPGLLAAITVAKAQDSLPLYRQCQIFARGEMKLSDSTLGDWFAFTADVLSPLAKLLTTYAYRGYLIGADDTGLPVLDKASGKHETTRGHMWAYVGYSVDGNVVVFDYTPDWTAKGPRSFLLRYNGPLQGDGYAGFKQALSRDDGELLVSDDRRLGCCMHVRRKFEAAMEAGDARGAIGLAFFKKIYAVERACKQERVDHHERHKRRQEQSLPVLDEFYQWARTTHGTLVPGDKLYKATTYAINQEKYVRRCFDDGRYEIDNGEVERQLRRVAIGRKNFLFAGSDAAARRLAVIYSVLGTAHMHGVDPQAYLTDVIDKLQNGWPEARLDELLPQRWVAPAEPRWFAQSTPI